MSVASGRRPAAVRRDGVTWRRGSRLRRTKCEPRTTCGDGWSRFSGSAAAARVLSTPSAPFPGPPETGTLVVSGPNAVQSFRKLPGQDVQGG